MRIGLFVPCYIDQLYPDVALATLELLEKAGMEVEFPAEQTCCGQPMANTGCQRETRPLAFKFLKIFRDYPYVVCPSGSCVAMVRHHYREHLAGQPGFEELVGKTYELCEFLGRCPQDRAGERLFSAQGGGPPELPWAAWSADGQFQRIGGADVQQDAIFARAIGRDPDFGTRAVG